MRTSVFPERSSFRAAARDLTLASNRISLAATAVMLAAAVMVAVVAPI